MEDLGAVSREVRAMIVQPVVSAVFGSGATRVAPGHAVAAFVKVRRRATAANDADEERGSGMPCSPVIHGAGDAAIESSNDDASNNIS